jgi:hypothetical protein
MEAFSRALRQLPTIIADNAGLDSSELVTQLRAAHARGEKNSGLDVVNGCVGDMWKMGVRESYKSKLQVNLCIYFYKFVCIYAYLYVCIYVYLNICFLCG